MRHCLIKPHSLWSFCSFQHAFATNLQCVFAVSHEAMLSCMTHPSSGIVHIAWLSMQLPSLCGPATHVHVHELTSCRRAILPGQSTDIVVRLKPGRAALKEQDDVLSQQPLGASPHFFSLKTPDPNRHDIKPVPCKRSPAASVHPKPALRAHVSMQLQWCTCITTQLA